MKKFLKGSVFLLALIFFCAVILYANKALKKEPQSDIEAIYAKDPSLSDLSLCTNKISAGFFSIQFLHEGYGTICYTDYAARKQFVLCAAPNCTHDSDFCKSYISLKNNALPPLILSDEKSIFLVYSATSSDYMAHIDQIDLNGDNRQTLVQLDQGESIYGGLYTDGQYLYFEKWSVEQTEFGPINRSAICQVDLAAKEMQPVCALPASYTVSGISQADYIVSSYSQDNKEQFYKISRLQSSGKWQLTDSPFYECDLSESGAIVLSGKLVEYFPAKKSVKITDIESGDSVAIDCAGEVGAYDPEWLPDISQLYGGSRSARYLKLTIPAKAADGTVSTKYKILDVEKEVFSSEIALKDESGRDMLPVGEYQEYFCVISGYDANDIPQYALISKLDYFSQTDNRISIENMF